MFTNKNQRPNHLQKCLVTVFVLSILAVTVLILYLENSPVQNNVFKNRFVRHEFSGVNEQLLNLKDFKFVINNKDICGNAKKTQVIVIVTSYAGDQETRSAVRRAFPQKLLAKFGIQRVFLLALINESKNTNGVSQNSILDENNRFKDLIQGNFIEDYRNLTYKHVMGLGWAANFCPFAKYVIKMDHDIIFDFFRLSVLLKNLPRVDNLLAGYVMTNMRPIREPANKWFVTPEEYPGSGYPSFLSGWLYITTPVTAAELFRLSRTETYFWIDDVFVTGVLRDKANVTLTRLNKHFTTHPEYLQCCIDKPKLSCEFLVGPTSGDNKLMVKFQRYAENCFYRTCKKRKEENSLRNTCVAKWKDEPFGKGKASVDLITFANV